MVNLSKQLVLFKMKKFHPYLFPLFLFILIFSIGAILKILFETFFPNPVPIIFFKTFTLSSFLICIFLFLKKKNKKIFKFGKIGQEQIFVIFILFALFVITNLFSLTFSEKDIYVKTLKSALFLSILSITINSVSEEIIYRGFIQPYINERIPTSATITPGNIFASLLMWTTHLGFFMVMEPLFACVSLILVAISTLTLGYLRDKTKGILVPVFVHIICNYIHISIHLFY